MLSEFIGHLHPLIVHFPIGILIFTILLSFIHYFFKKDFESVLSLTWLIGGILSSLACILGWVLAGDGDYQANTLLVHRWSGISVVFFSFGAYFFKKFRFFLACVLFGILILTTHFGTTLTHGEGYLRKMAQLIGVKKYLLDDVAVGTGIKKSPTPVPVLTSNLSQVMTSEPVLNKELDLEMIDFMHAKQVVWSPMGSNHSYSFNFVNVKQGVSEILSRLEGESASLVGQLKMGNHLDISFGDLDKFANLTTLQIEKTNLGDQDFQYISHLSHLVHLNIFGTQVSDKIIDELISMKQLKILYVWDTKITKQGILKLKQLRPDLKIESGDFKFSKPDTLRDILNVTN